MRNKPLDRFERCSAQSGGGYFESGLGSFNGRLDGFFARLSSERHHGSGNQWLSFHNLLTHLTSRSSDVNRHIAGSVFVMKLTLHNLNVQNTALYISFLCIVIRNEIEYYYCIADPYGRSNKYYRNNYTLERAQVALPSTKNGRRRRRY